MLSEEEGPSGEAYVVFETEYDIQKGLQKHNEHLESRYIEVSRFTENEMKRALDRCGLIGEKAFGDACVRPRGLPFVCSKEETAQFSTGHKLYNYVMESTITKMKNYTYELSFQSKCIDEYWSCITTLEYIKSTIIDKELENVTKKLEDFKRCAHTIMELNTIIKELREEKMTLGKKFEDMMLKGTNTIDNYKTDLLNSRKIVEDQTLKICNLEMKERRFKEENDALKSENKSLKEKINDLCKELSKTSDMLKVESDDKMKRLSSEINLEKEKSLFKKRIDEAEKERTHAIRGVLHLCKVYNIGPDNWEAFRSEENTMVGAHGQEASGSEENAMVQKESIQGQEMVSLDTLSISDRTPNIKYRLRPRV